jgi:hypothetical protein
MKKYPKIYIKWNKDYQSYDFWIMIKGRCVCLAAGDYKTKRQARNMAKENIELNYNLYRNRKD